MEILAKYCQDDLKCFYDLAERFANKELEPKALELDHYPYSEFNRAALAAAGEVELFKLTLPESLGGSGQGMAALSIVLSRLAQTDASFAALVFISALAQAALVKGAKKELAEKYLKTPGPIGFPAYASPTGLPLEVKADQKSGGYSLTGKFSYLALAPVGNLLIIPAEVSGQASLFLVDKNAPHLKLSEPVLSLGLRQCPAADLELNGVSCGPENLLDCEVYAELAAGFGGPWAALSLGVLVGSYHAAKAFAKERYQGGKQIIEHDQVRLMLANMAVLIEVSAAACMSASRAADEGRDLPGCFAAGIFVTDAVTRAATDGVQCLGGYGYIADYGQEKRMRDAKQIQALFGPSPVKRLEFFSSRLLED